VRRQLLLSTLAVIAAALVAFAVPLGIAVTSVLTTRALDAVQGQVEAIRLAVDQQARTCGEVRLVLALASRSPLDLALYDGEGRLLAAEADHTPAADRAVVHAVTEATPGRVATETALVSAVPMSTRACGAPLVLRGEVPADDLAESVRGAWLAIAAVGAAVLGFAALAASWRGRRLAAPFEALAGSARRLGDGDFTTRAPRSGLPEADAIADALDSTADRLGRAVQRSGAFTADASHQLRTPLTALRLNLESLSGADPAAVEATLAEADRLEATIEELVALTRLESTEQVTDVGALVTQRVDAWRELARLSGRRVEVEVLPTPPVRVRAAAVGQALQVLLDNAVAHGRGTVTVRVGPTLPAEEGPGVRVCVSDEGPGIDPRQADGRVGVDRGGGPLPLTGGRGLRLARSLVEAEGGRLTLEGHASGTRACLVLPG
jgi:signal transduction histidine kinase